MPWVVKVVNIDHTPNTTNLLFVLSQMSKLADAYTWPGVQRSLCRSCPYVPIRLVLILLSNTSKWRQFIIKAETNKIMIFYPRHQGIWDIEIWPSFLARSTDSPNPICYAWSNTCTKDEKVNWRQLLINLLLSDKTMLPFSRETSILIIVSKIVLSWANSSIQKFPFFKCYNDWFVFLNPISLFLIGNS